jgi:hypothetical protein
MFTFTYVRQDNLIVDTSSGHNGVSMRNDISGVMFFSYYDAQIFWFFLLDYERHMYKLKTQGERHTFVGPLLKYYKKFNKI